MQQYPIGSIMHRCIEHDLGLPSKTSWHKRLPQVPMELDSKEMYKAYYHDQHESDQLKKIMSQQYIADEPGKTVCRNLSQFTRRDQHQHYLTVSMPHNLRKALFMFRGSTLGLAHNHAWLYGSCRTCPLCYEEVETEDHMLLRCSGLRTERELLQSQYSWYIRLAGETDSTWMSRMISSANLVELARVICHLSNRRKHYLKQELG